MKTIFTVFSVLLLTATAFSAEVFTHGQFGSTMQKGRTSEVTFVTCFDVPLSTDTAKGYTIISRTGYLYQDRPDNEVGVKGAYEAFCGCKYFDLGKVRLNAILGTGAVVEAQDSGSTKVFFKGEFGVTVWKALTFSLGADYFPIDVGPDKTFFYAGIDFTP